MKNDEKIDIHLQEEEIDNLSEEEVAKQHYNTALRYIEIAEHMKQFEDQDKYYHRAIRYLKLAKPYKYDRALIIQMRKNKFAARSQGKITLYKEACQIRDKARTPNDYYSAQAIFERIHKYEVKHPIPENRVTPEVYEQVCQCSDSEQQAILCGQLAAEKQKELKRRSLLTSLLFLAAVGVFLYFTRTTAFRQCLASVYAHTGDYSGAWQSYYTVYEQTKEPAALENYKLYRYKDAVKASKTQNTEVVRSSFRALAELGYKDSEERLVKMEKQRVSEIAPGETIQFGQVNWRVMEHQNGKTLLLKDKAFGSTPFNTTDENCTWETSSLRKQLNSDFMDETFFALEKEAILTTTVKAEDNSRYGTDAGADTSDQVFIMSASEVQKYYDVIPKTKSCWWLRTPGAHKNSMCFSYQDKTIMDYGYDVSNSKISVKPAIWVNTK